MKIIQRFTPVFGPASSLSDFLTFYALIRLFGAGETLFFVYLALVEATKRVFCRYHDARQ